MGLSLVNVSLFLFIKASRLFLIKDRLTFRLFCSIIGRCLLIFFALSHQLALFSGAWRMILVSAFLLWIKPASDLDLWLSLCFDLWNLVNLLATVKGGIYFALVTN